MLMGTFVAPGSPLQLNGYRVCCAAASSAAFSSAALSGVDVTKLVRSVGSAITLNNHGPVSPLPTAEAIRVFKNF